MEDQDKRSHASSIAGDVAGRWQDRSRIIILVAYIAVAYLVDYLFFRKSGPSEFVILLAIIGQIGLQVLVPDKVYSIVFRDTFEAEMRRL